MLKIFKKKTSPKGILDLIPSLLSCSLFSFSCILRSFSNCSLPLLCGHWFVAQHHVWYVVQEKLKEPYWNTWGLSAMVSVVNILLAIIHISCKTHVRVWSFRLYWIWSIYCFYHSEVTKDGLFSVGEMECMVSLSLYMFTSFFLHNAKFY